MTKSDLRFLNAHMVYEDNSHRLYYVKRSHNATICVLMREGQYNGAKKYCLKRFSDWLEATQWLECVADERGWKRKPSLVIRVHKDII